MEEVTREYTNGDITIIWKAGKCIHAGNCARSLRAVFKPKEQPWVNPEGATSDEIRSTVVLCPSGALSLKP